MASCKEPAEEITLDPGNVTEIFIDGMAAHAIRNGLVRVALYANQPCIETDGGCRHTRIIVAKLVYTLDAAKQMRRQVTNPLTTHAISAMTMMLLV